MIAKSSDLMNLCVNELPQKTITVEGGLEVRVQALEGIDVLRVSSLEMLDEKIMFALPKGLVEPKLTHREIKQLTNRASKVVNDIFIGIMELSELLIEEQSEEEAQAEKN